MPILLEWRMGSKLRRVVDIGRQRKTLEDIKRRGEAGEVDCYVCLERLSTSRRH
eukprot:CAMPEP_0119471194 /NCGR_PEP_ID=MMETSP1344-20130328/3760_1 /TAXON_ID=236787 /ORGANISM="Florenciella parvula, Strain CCMP2471" /LENGTH=53 /DNA_ID=CAMNT_0007503941 /DNA_START=117 /DNA_END=278 /DNA_ORIENTATION=-